MSANMKPQGGKSIQGPLLRGLAARSVTGQNGQAAKDELSAVWQGGWMPENISGVPAGRSVFHLTSPLIGLLDGVAHVEQKTDLERKIVSARELANSTNCGVIVEDADVACGKVRHQAALLVGHAELQTDLGNGVADGVARANFTGDDPGLGAQGSVGWKLGRRHFRGCTVVATRGRGRRIQRRGGNSARKGNRKKSNQQSGSWRLLPHTCLIGQPGVGLEEAPKHAR